MRRHLRRAPLSQASVRPSALQESSHEQRSLTPEQDVTAVQPLSTETIPTTLDVPPRAAGFDFGAISILPPGAAGTPEPPSSPTQEGTHVRVQPFQPQWQGQRVPMQRQRPPEDLGQRIRRAQGGGQALHPEVQRSLEAGLGADLSGVRVHTDGEANALSNSVDALAFTTGPDIFFRQGMYDPASSRGFHLLAHEATHTIQQANGPVDGTPTSEGVSISRATDPLERAAEATANQIVCGHEVGSRVQRTVSRRPSDQGVAVQRFGDKLSFVPNRDPNLPLDVKPKVEELRQVILSEQTRKRQVKVELNEAWRARVDEAAVVADEDTITEEKAEGIRNRQRHEAFTWYVGELKAKSGWQLNRIVQNVKTLPNMQVSTQGNVTTIHYQQPEEPGKTPKPRYLLLTITQQETYTPINPGSRVYTRQGAIGNRQYIQDRRGQFIARYQVRFITPEERDRIANKYGKGAGPKSAAVLVPREANAAPSQKEKQEWTLTAPQAQDRDVQEYMLNRAANPQRLLPITKTKSHIIGNKGEYFLQSGNLYYKQWDKTVRQGGGVVLLDLAQIPQQNVAAQYTEATATSYQTVGNQVRRQTYFQGYGPQKDIEVAIWTAQKNRETHIGPDIPDNAVIAWSPDVSGQWSPLSEVTQSRLYANRHLGDDTFYESSRDPYTAGILSEVMNADMAKALVAGRSEAPGVLAARSQYFRLKNVLEGTRPKSGAAPQGTPAPKEKVQTAVQNTLVKSIKETPGNSVEDVAKKWQSIKTALDELDKNNMLTYNPVNGQCLFRAKEMSELGWYDVLAKARGEVNRFLFNVHLRVL